MKVLIALVGGYLIGARAGSRDFDQLTKSFRALLRVRGVRRLRERGADARRAHAPRAGRRRRQRQRPAPDARSRRTRAAARRPRLTVATQASVTSRPMPRSPTTSPDDADRGLRARRQPTPDVVRASDVVVDVDRTTGGHRPFERVAHPRSLLGARCTRGARRWCPRTRADRCRGCDGTPRSTARCRSGRPRATDRRARAPRPPATAPRTRPASPGPAVAPSCRMRSRPRRRVPRRRRGPGATTARPRRACPSAFEDRLPSARRGRPASTAGDDRVDRLAQVGGKQRAAACRRARRPSAYPDIRSAARFHSTMCPTPSSANIASFAASTSVSSIARRRVVEESVCSVPGEATQMHRRAHGGAAVTRRCRTGCRCRPRRHRLDARPLVRGRSDDVVRLVRLARTRPPRRGRVRAPGDHGQAGAPGGRRASTRIRWRSCACRRDRGDVVVVIGRDRSAARLGPRTGADLGRDDRVARLWPSTGTRRCRPRRLGRRRRSGRRRTTVASRSGTTCSGSSPTCASSTPACSRRVEGAPTRSCITCSDAGAVAEVVSVGDSPRDAAPPGWDERRRHAPRRHGRSPVTSCCSTRAPRSHASTRSRIRAS